MKKSVMNTNYISLTGRLNSRDTNRFSQGKRSNFFLCSTQAKKTDRDYFQSGDIFERDNFSNTCTAKRTEEKKATRTKVKLMIKSNRMISV